MSSISMSLRIIRCSSVKPFTCRNFCFTARTVQHKLLNKTVASSSMSNVICSLKTTDFNLRSLHVSSELCKGHSHWQNALKDKTKGDSAKAALMNSAIVRIKRAFNGQLFFPLFCSWTYLVFYLENNMDKCARIIEEEAKKGASKDTLERQVELLKVSNKEQRIAKVLHIKSVCKVKTLTKCRV